MDSLFNIHELTPALRQAGVTAIPSGGLRVDAVELVDGDRTARLVTNAATFDLDIATLAIRQAARDGNDSTQISKKVRGLLYILAQHPSYHVR